MSKFKNGKVRIDKDLIEVKPPKNNNYDIIPSHPRPAVFLGVSGTGKTNLVAQILTDKSYLKFYFDRIYIFTEFTSEPLYQMIKRRNEAYQQKYTIVHIKEEATPEKLGKLYKKIYDRLHKSLENKVEPEKVLIYIDDPDEDKASILRSKECQKFFTRGREHINTSIWVGIQAPTMIDKKMRGSTKHWVIFGDNDGDTVEDIAKMISTSKVDIRQTKGLLQALDDKPKYSFIHVNKNKKVKNGRYSFMWDQAIIPV